jgi:hypothetical protein
VKPVESERAVSEVASTERVRAVDAWMIGMVFFDYVDF